MIFRVALARRVSEFSTFSDIPEFDGTLDGLATRFNRNFGHAHNWSDILYQEVAPINFPTSNPNEIKYEDIEVLSNDSDSNYLFYVKVKYKGKVYDTREVITYPVKVDVKIIK